jgi:manganese/zinc/iron transport system substrate-binding protein
MRFSYLIIFSIFVTFGSAFIYYVKKENSFSVSRKPLIVCSTSMIADLIHEIVRDKVEVKALMGPGVDPHTYLARPSDVTLLTQADLIFYHGLHLEGKMADVFEQLATRKKVIPLAHSLSKEDLIQTDVPGIFDPHIWHDVSLWSKLIEAACSHLIAQYPEAQQEFIQAADEYSVKLKELDLETKKSLGQIPTPKRVLVSAHDAFHYFGKAYGFEVVGLQGISTDSQITLQDIDRLIRIILEKKVSVLFLETALPEHALKAVQEAVISQGHQVHLGNSLYADALGMKNSPAGTYCGMIRYNSTTILNALLR